MTQSAVPAESPSAAGHQTGLWRPLVYRATAALAFGALTIFWADPSVTGMGIAGGLYLGGTGLLLLHLVAAAGLTGQRSRKLLLTGAIALLGAGLTVAVLPGDQTFAIAAAAGLSVSGISEIAAGSLEKGHVLARDWLISGVVALGTAVALPFFTTLGPHALLGVAGGGAIMTGVLWMLSGLTVRHEAVASGRKR